MPAYSVPAEQWPETPIVISTNPVTGKPHGDDAGYRKVATLEDNHEELVKPAGIETRPVYDGKDEYGREHNDLLPGGVREGVLVVRKTLARALDYANQVLTDRLGGEYALVGLDGFRSGDRQRAGWDRLRKNLMTQAGVEDSKYADKGAIWGGNTCDTQLKVGPSGTAAFGGQTAETAARRDWALA